MANNPSPRTDYFGNFGVEGLRYPHEVLELKNGRHGEGAQQRNKEGRSLAHLGRPWSKTKLRSQSLERRSYPRSRHDTRRRPHRAARRVAAGPPSKVGGISRPSVFAVLRLITNSNLVGCMTGRSAGFAPLRMRLA